MKIHMESSDDMIGSNREKFVNYEKYRLTVRKRCAILTITKMIIITDLEKVWINQFSYVSFCIIADIIAKYIMCINMWKNERRFIMKFVCTVCGYVYEGDAAPAECPICHAGADKFKKVEDGAMTLAAEHEFGVYASTVKNNPEISDEDKKFIFDQLKANFNGECSEVGMYLCMARIAHREGYPEIGLYWEKAAYEEAEHAAKFAEMLGEDLEPNMTSSTKKNLAWRVDCEYGATAGKVDLAKCAKKNNLDAIHDTVHEMARDEARHGKALEGLLKRYFG